MTSQSAEQCCEAWEKAQHSGTDNEGYGTLLHDHANPRRFGKVAEPRQFDVRLAHKDALMETRTGPVLVNVVVPRILDHLKLESVHGQHALQPKGTDNG